jgi:hypothetical protein
MFRPLGQSRRRAACAPRKGFSTTRGKAPPQTRRGGIRDSQGFVRYGKRTVRGRDQQQPGAAERDARPAAGGRAHPVTAALLTSKTPPNNLQKSAQGIAGDKRAVQLKET